MSKYTDPSQRLRPETVIQQTGQGLQAWFQLLEQCQQCQQQHRLLAQYLAHHADLSQWWIHTIVTAYEYQKGWRTVNKQQGSYTFTVQKTLSHPLEQVYLLFTDTYALTEWLSPHMTIDCYTGRQFNFDDIAYISFLRIQLEKQIQLTVQTIPTRQTTKVVIDFAALTEDKTKIRIKHSLLKNAAAVQTFRSYWLSTLTAFKHYLKKKSRKKIGR